MRIIQEESRVKNLALVYEMQDFFDDESGELDVALRKRRLIDEIQICSLCLMVVGILFVVKTMTNIEVKSVSELCRVSGVMLLCIIGTVGVRVYYFKEKMKLEHAGIFKKYGPAELMIYWLFAEPKPQKIAVSKDREEIQIYKENSVISLDVDGFQIAGTGTEVHTIDLDNMIVMT